MHLFPGVNTVGDIRTHAEAGGVDPEDLRELGEEAGWLVEVGLPDSGDPGRMDVLFTRPQANAHHLFPVRRSWRGREIRRYATDPLRDRKVNALVSSLRAYLMERLPEYMVPAAYVRLEAIPLTANGKVDRRGLPEPGGEAYARRGYEAPVGEVEEVMAEIWEELLGVERVGRWDDFFELGGHSLLAVQVVSRVRQLLGVELGLGELFTKPVLRDLSEELKRAGRSELPEIEAVERSRPLALSFAQQRLWFLEQLGGLGPAYHISRAMRLRGELDRGALREALNGLIERHEALRTTFAIHDGVPEQRIAEREGNEFDLREEDLRGREDREVAVAELVAKRTREGFDLGAGPLIRGTLIQVGIGITYC